MEWITARYIHRSKIDSKFFRNGQSYLGFKKTIQSIVSQYFMNDIFGLQLQKTFWIILESDLAKRMMKFRKSNKK